MAVRLKDIAQDLGVSTVTVSKVLRGNSDIGELTRARVLRRMKELNYQPNLLARALASGQSFAVGLVVPDLVHPFFAEFAKSLSGVLRQSGFALILASSEEDPEIERNEIRTLLNRGVDAILIASCQPLNMEKPFLGEERTPLILIDRGFPSQTTNFVGSDDVMVGELATRHLVEIGRKRIAHIGGTGTSPSSTASKAIAAHLLRPICRCRRVTSSPANALRRPAIRPVIRQCRKLLGRKVRPDAVFCYNDLSAIGAMQAAMDMGLRIPEDIAFVGCGNLRYAPYLKIPLTSIDQATDRMGEIAARLAIELAGKPDRHPQVTLLEPTLVIRRSSVCESPK